MIYLVNYLVMSMHFKMFLISKQSFVYFTAKCVT